MKYVFFLLYFGVFVIFFFFLLWVNVTKGYYQKECCGCKVDYLPADYEEINCYQERVHGKTRISCAAVVCEKNYLNLLKLKLGELDAYK